MKNILIVDDSSSVQRVLSYTLQRNGYRVAVAGDGARALTQLQADSFDLAFLDLAMPDMDGITLLKLLRADSRYSQLPIIMLTASGNDQDRIEARQQGANEFLTKPASSRELLDTVHKLLD